MAELGGDARPADVHPPVDDQGPADAAADVRVEDDAAAAAGAEAGLAQSGHVRIVGHAGRHAERLGGTSRPAESRPSRPRDGS